MGMRHAAVVAGLALGLMSGTAKASITYDVDLSLPSFGTGTVKGTIVTDGNTGALTTNDILSFSLALSNPGFLFGPGTSGVATGSGAGNNVSMTAGTVNLQATPSQLTFNYDNTNNFLTFGNVQGGNYVQFFSGDSAKFESPAIFIEAGNVETNYAPVSVIGTSSPSNLSTVPLPASAPMFGAALIALGAAGYGLKRKSKAAAPA